MQEGDLKRNGHVDYEEQQGHAVRRFWVCGLAEWGQPRHRGADVLRLCCFFTGVWAARGMAGNFAERVRWLPSSPTARAASFAASWRLGRVFRGCTRWLGSGTWRDGGWRPARVDEAVGNCGKKNRFFGRVPAAVSEELFSRIRHAPRPDCLELAPTAAAQWR